mgnify:CR=1 FL=1
MPKRNPGANPSLKQAYIDESTLSCTSIQNVDAGLTCSLIVLNTTYDRLKIENILPNGQPDRDVIMIIEIDGIYNPLSMGTRFF